MKRIVSVSIGSSSRDKRVEALLICVAGKTPDCLREEEYYSILEKLDLKPRVVYLN